MRGRILKTANNGDLKCTWAIKGRAYFWKKVLQHLLVRIEMTERQISQEFFSYFFPLHVTVCFALITISYSKQQARGRSRRNLTLPLPRASKPDVDNSLPISIQGHSSLIQLHLYFYLSRCFTLWIKTLLSPHRSTRLVHEMKLLRRNLLTSTPFQNLLLELKSDLLFTLLTKKNKSSRKVTGKRSD